MNSFETADWIAMESLRLLVNPLEVAQFFNTDYNDQLTKEFPVGATFRIPLPNLPLIRDGITYVGGNIQDRSTEVTCDQIFGVDLDWDSIELALSMPRSEERVSKKYLKPAMAKIAQEIDSRAARYAYLNTPNVVGTLGTNPTTFDAVFGAAGQRLTELASPPGEKGMILSPGLARTLRAGAVSYFNPQSELNRMWKTGSIGEANGFDTYQSMSLYSHTAGTWAGTVEITGGNQSGSSLILTATTGDTFLAGDVFNIAGVYDINPMTLRTTSALKQFVVLATVTAAAGSATVTISPAIVGPGSPNQNVSALPAAGADLTLFPGTTTPNGLSGINSLALGKNAFALVGVKLQNPKASSAEIVAEKRDPNSGLSVSFLRMFEPRTRTWINRFDVLLGFGRLYNDHDAVRVLGA